MGYPMEMALSTCSLSASKDWLVQAVHSSATTARGIYTHHDRTDAIKRRWLTSPLMSVTIASVIGP